MRSPLTKDSSDNMRYLETVQETIQVPFKKKHVKYLMLAGIVTLICAINDCSFADAAPVSTSKTLHFTTKDSQDSLTVTAASYKAPVPSGILMGSSTAIVNAPGLVARVETATTLLVEVPSTTEVIILLPGAASASSVTQENETPTITVNVGVINGTAVPEGKRTWSVMPLESH